ncbi:MAG: hypothetical protein V7746_02760 [Halioglobus sp.]
MSEDSVSWLIEMIMIVAVSSLPILFVISVLNNLRKRYGKAVVKASQATSDTVVAQSKKAKQALDTRRAEQELDKLLKLRNVGIISESEFEDKAADLRDILRSSVLGK